METETLANKVKSPPRTQYPLQRERAQTLLNSTVPPMRAADIERQLAQEFEEFPTARQIGNWIRQGTIVIESQSGPWTVADAERPEDIPLVLAAINLYRHPTDKVWVTVARGRWVARLMRAGLPPAIAFLYAGYALREDPLTFTRRLADLFDEDRRADRAKELLKGEQK